jgi:hypothetical protein
MIYPPARIETQQVVKKKFASFVGSFDKLEEVFKNTFRVTFNKICYALSAWILTEGLVAIILKHNNTNNNNP